MKLSSYIKNRMISFLVPFHRTKFLVTAKAKIFFYRIHEHIHMIRSTLFLFHTAMKHTILWCALTKRNEPNQKISSILKKNEILLFAFRTTFRLLLFDWLKNRNVSTTQEMDEYFYNATLEIASTSHWLHICQSYEFIWHLLLQFQLHWLIA